MKVLLLEQSCGEMISTLYLKGTLISLLKILYHEQLMLLAVGITIASILSNAYWKNYEYRNQPSGDTFSA